MFEFIRTHQRLMQIFLAIIIVPSFLFVGASSFGGFGDDVSTIAKVGGQPITQQDWDNAQRQQIDRYRQAMGAQFDQKMFDTPEAKQGVLDGLIGQRAVTAEVKNSHLSISDAAIAQSIAQIPGVLKDDGKFDDAAWIAMLATRNMKPLQYEALLRADMAAQQLSGAVEATAFTPRALTSRIAEMNEQEREVQELLLPVASFVPQVKVTDAMVKAYYDKNGKLFEVPEQVKVEYVVFNGAAVASQVQVSDAEVAKFYEDNKTRFTLAETRQVSHILIALKKDASAADKAAAKTKAEAVLAEVRKTPADFAKIAKAQSQDPASAELGGDLGLYAKGTMASAAVEDAAVKLKQGEISDLVQSDYGYHIITITSLKPAVLKPLDEVKGEIAAELTKQKTAKKYSELAGQFTDTVYQQADSLKPVADLLKLKVETVGNLARTPSPALGDAPFNNAKFLTAIFADDALKNKHNTEAVEVAPNVMIAGHVLEFKPASKRPLAEVDAPIRQRVAQEEALKLAQKAGAEKLAALQKSGDATDFAAAKLVSRSKDEGINPVALRKVLGADASKLPAYVGVDVPGLGYGIYRIAKVQQGALNQARRDAEKEQLNQIQSQQEMYAYVEMLKNKAKVKILKPIATASADPAP